jgi:hypothetical protein
MLSAVFPLQYVLCSSRSRAPAFGLLAARTTKMVVCVADRVKPADLRHLAQHM